MSLWSRLGGPTLDPAINGERHYLLVDGAQVDRFSDRIARLGGIREHQSVFAGPLAPERADATPHLIELHTPEKYQHLMRGDFGDALAFPGALSWLVSPLELDALASRLRARLDARLPDDFECVNRFFDGRVTPWLHACLHKDQRAAFFSVSTHWWVIAHNHQWQSLQCEFELSDSFSPPLVLDEAQQAQMIDACYPYTVIEHFAQTDEELLEAVSPAERYAFFRQILTTAARYGIDGGASAVLFCTLALTRGPNFHSAAPWPGLLEQVKQGEITLQQAVKAQHD